MASTCYQPIANNCPYKPILNPDFQFPKPPASSDTTVFDCAARFNLSPLDTPGLIHNHQLQGLPAAGQKYILCSFSAACLTLNFEVGNVRDVRE
jgi:hypothetical protein